MKPLYADAQVDMYLCFPHIHMLLCETSCMDKTTAGHVKQACIASMHRKPAVVLWREKQNVHARKTEWLNVTVQDAMLQEALDNQQTC